MYSVPRIQWQRLGSVAAFFWRWDIGQAETFELPDNIEAIEYYYEQGLSVIQPTPERVTRFLESGGRRERGDVHNSPDLGKRLRQQAYNQADN